MAESIIGSFVLKGLATIGAANWWNPVGWTILAVVGGAAAGYGMYLLASNSPSGKLGKSMKENGMPKPKGPPGKWHAHHIIPYQWRLTGS